MIKFIFALPDFNHLAVISYNRCLLLTKVFETSQAKGSVFLRANLEDKNVLFVP